MTIHQRIRMTVDQFLVWAEGQPGRWELVDGEPVRMAPERARHNKIKYLVCRALDDAVAAAGLDCEVFTDGMTVQIDSETCYEPDAAVQCGLKQDLDSVALPSPLIVVEVASPSSSKIDTTTKLIDYFKVASVSHYLILVPERRTVIHHSRDAVTIRTETVIGGTLRLDPPAIVIAVDNLWPPESA